MVDAGFTILATDHRVRRTGVTVSFTATDAEGDPWLFDVAGVYTTHRGGLLRAETVWRSLGRAHALRSARGDVPLVFLTSHLPRRPSEGDVALRAAGPEAFFDVIDLLSPESRRRLASYAAGGRRGGPQPGFWMAAELDRCDDVPIS